MLALHLYPERVHAGEGIGMLQRLLDLRQREAMFLHMKQEVAALADVVKIAHAPQRSERIIVRQGKDFVPASADIGGRCRLAPGRDLRARAHDRATRRRDW
jgi:hypothetical protein